MADDDSGSFGSDSVTETSSEGWLSRLGGTIKGVLIGLVMVVGAFPLLFWNEGRAVRTTKSLNEGQGAVATTASDRVDPAKEGRLVHVTGRARTADTVADPVFNVRINALQLRRKVEMYQWKETSKQETRNKLGGGTETVTTYTYDKAWSETFADSSKFKEQQGHRNPAAMPYKSEKWSAGKVTLGAYTLTPSQASQISGDEPLKVAAPARAPDGGRRLIEYDGGLYAGDNANQPQLGDLRIHFTQVGESDISVVAKQSGNSFEPYHAKAGADVDLLRKGIVGAEQMFAAAEQENTAMTWILRAVGFILMAMGFAMMLKPLSVLAGIVPLFGDIIEVGAGVIAFLIAGVLSLSTITVAWIFYRPLLGVGLLVVVGACLYGIWHLVGKARAKRIAAGPATAAKAAQPA